MKSAGAPCVQQCLGLARPELLVATRIRLPFRIDAFRTARVTLYARSTIMTTKRTVTAHDVKTAVEELTVENSPESPVIQNLRRQVANAFVIYTNYKHYHWQTFGPLFRDLHLMFDEFAQQVLETVDQLAERVRMIGQDPPAHLIELADLASVSTAAPLSTMRDMIEEADRNALIVIKEMRGAVRVAEDHDDPGTVDVLSRFVQIHEKHEWWLRDILRKRDGLCG
jgi:starvation-inducible DNA-binding protein